MKQLIEYTIFTKKAKARHLFRHIFSKTNGFAIAKDCQKTTSKPQARYVYGEIMYASFLALLNAAAPKPGDVFCDLGSGIGKPVLVAAMQHPFSRAYGVEIVDGLHQASLACRKRLFAHRFHHCLLGQTTVAFQHADILTHAMDDADIVFVNATAFIGEFWDAVHTRLRSLKPGTRIITITKQLISPEFELLSHQQAQMTWGFASAFVFLKTV